MTGVESRGGGSLQNPVLANVRMSDLPSDIEVTPVNLAAEDGAPSKGLLYKLERTTPKTGVHLMHPRTDQSQNYNIVPLVRAGYAVLGRGGRWPNNDVATVHEPLLLDVAAGIRLLKGEGCEQIVLLGNSGGSSLATMYQWQARRPVGERLTMTPAGDQFDLNAFDLPPADGIVIVAGHIGEGPLLSKLIDPAVVDEADPLATDPDLDLYDPANGFIVPPESSSYSDAFLGRYRQAQHARVRRLDAKAKSLIARQRAAADALAAGDASTQLERAARMGWYMIIYRTTADPASVDLHLDPDDRRVTTYSTNRPDLENYGENGFSRYVTPRAWLSTWSALSSNARTIDNLREISDPLLIVHYAGDAGTRLAEVANMQSASASDDASVHIVRDADHYGFKINGDGSQGARSTEGTEAVASWMVDRFRR